MPDDHNFADCHVPSGLYRPRAVLRASVGERRGPQAGYPAHTRTQPLERRIHSSQLGFFLGTLAPLLRASDRPIAIACSRLFTTPPLPFFPERSSPRFSRCTAFLTHISILNSISESSDRRNHQYSCGCESYEIGRAHV